MSPCVRGARSVRRSGTGAQRVSGVKQQRRGGALSQRRGGLMSRPVIMLQGGGFSSQQWPFDSELIFALHQPLYFTYTTQSTNAANVLIMLKLWSLSTQFLQLRLS